jgi:hypothetical protein
VTNQTINPFFFVAFFLCVGLGLRIGIDMIFHADSIWVRVKKFFELALLVFFAWALRSYLPQNLNNVSWQSALFAIALAVGAFVHKPLVLRHYLAFRILRALVYLFLLFTALLALSLRYYKQLHIGNPELILEMTGQIEQRTIQPIASVSKEIVPHHRVLLKDIKGNLLADELFYGDLVSLRVRTIQFPTAMVFLGFRPLYRVDMLYNGFLDGSRYGIFPVTAKDMLRIRSGVEKLCDRFFAKLWTDSFYSPQPAKWIKTAALQSQYFPLVDKNQQPFRGCYELRLYPSGISGKAISSSAQLSPGDS